MKPVLGLITVLGFIAGILSRRGSFPDLLVLILLGLLLGPVNSAWLHIAAIENGVGAIPFDVVTPFFGALALAVIMFDAGLHLPLRDLIGNMRRGFVHTTVVFALTTVATAAVVHIVLGFPWLVAIFFGAITGGVGSAVATSVVRRVRMSDQARSVVTIECVLVDVLTIGVAIAMIEALRTGTLTAGGLTLAIVQTVAVGITLGLAVGLGFAFVLPRMRGLPNLYILTLGSFVGTYALIEYLGGSGPMGVLAFGIVLGNSSNPWFSGHVVAPEVTAEIQHFHAQATFLIRTFFFVLLGLSFTFEMTPGVAAGMMPQLRALAPWTGSLALLWAAGIGAYGAILVVRGLVSRFTATDPGDAAPLTLIVGRGLGTAVLATFPFTVPEMRDAGSAYAQVMTPYREVFPALASLVIILTVLTTAVGVFVLQLRRGRVEAPEVEGTISRVRP